MGNLGFLELALILAALLLLAFEIAMFVDMLKNDRIPHDTKVMWAAGMLLIHPFVAIFYYFTARNRE